jgi:subtilisin
MINTQSQTKMTLHRDPNQENSVVKQCHQKESGSAVNRHIVVFQNHFNHDLLRKWRRESSITKVAHTTDFQYQNWSQSKTADADLVIYDRLGIGLLNLNDPDQISWFRERTRRQRSVQNMRPENRMSLMVAQGPKGSDDCNMNDSVNDFTNQPNRLQRIQSTSHSWKGFADSRRLTWAMQATGLSQMRYNGNGSKIAILDTGLDFNHQDWRNRESVSRSFVGQSAMDDHGHGTQCAGLACGTPSESGYPRYGAAPQANLYIAKVLEHDGSGPDSAILAGIDWALGHGCHVLSLSVGVQTSMQTPDPVYETVAQRSLKAGMLFIAAAGNDSARPNLIRPVCRPANCPSIFAVGAVDRYLRLAHFSNGTVWPGHCQVDGVAPGVDVLTSNRGANPYGRFSGTSMAAPLCAGIAAVLIQEDGDCLGPALWQRLSAYSRRLPLHSTDVGNGLVCIPQKN